MLIIGSLLPPPPPPPLPPAAERHLLNDGCDIFLRKVLQVDTHSKKGDPTEPKILVGRARLFLLREYQWLGACS